MRTLPFVGAAFLLSIVTACSSAVETTHPGGGGSSGAGEDGGAAPQGGSGPGKTAEEACADLAKASCDLLSSCSNSFIVSLVDGDMPTCLSTRTDACVASLSAADSGSTPATKEACALATPTESCADILDLNGPPACKTPAGKRPMGAACGTAAQCVSAFCSIANDANCGTCTGVPKVGDDCSTALDCAQGQTCNTTTAKCQIPIQTGGACTASDQCDTFLGCTSGTCQPLPAKLGATCDPNIGCDVLRGFLCFPGNACSAIQLAAAGEPCGVIGTTAYALCKDDAICNNGSATSGTCIANAGEGETCDTVFGPACSPAFSCITTPSTNTGTCQAFDPSTCN